MLQSHCGDRPSVNTYLFRTGRSFFIPVTKNLHSGLCWFTSIHIIDNKKLDSLNCALTMRGYVGCNGIACHSCICGVEIIRIGKCNESGVRHIQLRISGTQVFVVLFDCLLISKPDLLEVHIVVSQKKLLILWH